MKKKIYLQKAQFLGLRKTKLLRFSIRAIFENRSLSKTYCQNKKLNKQNENFLPLVFLQEQKVKQRFKTKNSFNFSYFCPCKSKGQKSIGQRSVAAASSKLGFLLPCFDMEKRGGSKISKMTSFFSSEKNFSKHLNKLELIQQLSFQKSLKKNIFLNYCLPQKKSETETKLNFSFLKQRSTNYWQNSFATFYYLLIAYKKTMRVKGTYYFNNSTNLNFFIAVSPFVAYFIQISFEKYDLKYQQNMFFNKSLPGLRKPIQELSWETYAYTKYANKMTSNFINKVASVEDCFFLSLNPYWQFKQKQLWTATFESSNSEKKWFFLPSRYFYQFLTKNQKQELNQIGIQKFKPTLVDSQKKPNFSYFCPCKSKGQKSIGTDFSEIRFWKGFQFLSSSSTDKQEFRSTLKDLEHYQSNLKKELIINSRWQIFFNELDDIPTKLNSVFQPKRPFSIQYSNQIRKSSLLFTFDAFPFISSSSSSIEFLNKPSLDNQKNSNFFFSKGESKEFQSLLKTPFSLSDFKTYYSVLSTNYKASTLNLKAIAQTYKKKNNFLFLSKKQRGNENLNQKKTDLSLINFKSKKILLAPNLVKIKVPQFERLDLIGLKKIQLDPLKNSDQTWISLLTEIFNKSILKNEHSFLLNRNFQYNLDLGFFQLGKLVKVNILNPTRINSFQNSLQKNQILSDPKSTKERSTQENLVPFFQQEAFETIFLSEKHRKTGKIPLSNTEEKNGNFTLKDSSLPFPLQRLPERTGEEKYEILPKSVSLIWRNSLREDLRKPFPFWIKSLKAQTLPNSKVEAKFKAYLDTPPFLVQMTNFENILANLFKFDEIITNALVKKPESILRLTQNSNTSTPFLVGASQNLFARQNFVQSFGHLHKSKSKKLLSLDTNPFIIKNNKTFSQVRRKLSGYLYPDSLRETIFKNLSHFTIKFANLEKNKNLLNKKYPQGFTEIVSPSLFSNEPNKKQILFLSQKQWSHSSLLQIDQPLVQNFIDSKNFSYFCPCNSKGRKSMGERVEKPVDSILNILKLQKKLDILNNIEPDQSLTTKKDYFFGIPTNSPVYGLSLNEYKGKYEPRKKDLQKNNLIAPYENSLNFLIQSKGNLIQKNILNEELTNFSSFCKGKSKGPKTIGQKVFPNSPKFTKKDVFNEMTKAALFSNVRLEKSLPFFPTLSKTEVLAFNKNESKLLLELKPSFSLIKELSKKKFFDNISLRFFYLGKNQKNDRFEQQAIPYKTYSNYTKSKLLKSPLNLLDTSLAKSRFSTNLYEPIRFKTVTLLSQLGFAFIVLKLVGILYNEYREEMGYYINEFAVFLNEYEKTNFLDFLDFFNPKENFRVIKKTNKKFSDLVGGRFLLTEFGEVILLLRNSGKVFSKIAISKPQLVSFDPFSKFHSPDASEKKTSWLLSENSQQGKQEKRTFFLQNKIQTFQRTFKEKLKQHESFSEKTNLKLENFIPKGILLVGPPGTGKTLLVKALSGEASVPVIVESGKMLTTNMENNGAERLKDLFKAAREMSPCILFLDEVDTIGQKRENVISTMASGEKENKVPNTLNLIYFQNGLTDNLNSNFSEPFSDLNFEIVNPVLNLQSIQSLDPKNQEVKDLKTQITNQKISSVKQQHQDLIMLTQLLCELDGLNKRQEIIVIGATNRPTTLDSALTRPGRFGKVIYLDLPGKQKRFELLKFYSHSNLKSSQLIENQFSNLGSFLTKFSPFKINNFDNFLKSLKLFPPAFQIRKIEKEKHMAVEKNPKLYLTTKKEEGGRVLNSLDPEYLNKANYEEKHFLKGSNKLKKTLGVADNINWNYFANQTLGLSAAHLAVAMNRSALKAIFLYFSTTQKESNFLKGSFPLPLPHLSLFKEKHIGQQVKKDKKKMKNFSFIPFEKSIPRIQTDKYLKKLESKDSQKRPTLNDGKGSDLPVFEHEAKVKISKAVKLNILAQSGIGYNKTLNSLTLFSSESYPEQKFEKQPLHNFETIEYGIQTVSTMNTTLQIKLIKVQKINKKIMGQLARDDFSLKISSRNMDPFLKFPLKNPKALPNLQKYLILAFKIFAQSKNFIFFNKFDPRGHTAPDPCFYIKDTNFSYFYPCKSQGQKSIGNEKSTGSKVKVTNFWNLKPFSPGFQDPKKQNLLKNQNFKASSKLRKSFYQKHRRYLRTLALLGVNSMIKLSPKKLNFSYHFSYQKSMGPVLLQNNNLLFSTLDNLKILSKYLNRIIKNNSFGWVLLFNSTCLIQNSLFVFSIQKQNQKNLNYLYYDLLFLKESSQKPKPINFLKWETFILEKQTSLFGDSLFINRSAYYLTGKSLIKFANCDEKEMEQPIRLWFFTGSIETRQKRNLDSTIFLTKIQFENYLLSLIAGKATETLMLSNQLDIQQKNESNIGMNELKQLGPFIKFMSEKYGFYSEKQLTRKQLNINLTENTKQINPEEFQFFKELTTLKASPVKNLTDLPTTSLRSAYQFQSFEQPWWQFKSIHLLSSLNLKYGEWYRFFLAEEQQNLRNIEWVAPDTYFHNQVTNACLSLNKDNDLTTNLLVEGFFVNRDFILKYLLFSKLNWNQIQLLEPDSIVSYFLFESFNKIFILLEKNRELVDSLVYSLFCHESLRDFEIKKVYRRYFQ